jgi:hypothetical protein
LTQTSEFRPRTSRALLVQRSRLEVSSVDNSALLLFAVSDARVTYSRLSERYPPLSLARVQSMSRSFLSSRGQRSNRTPPPSSIKSTLAFLNPIRDHSRSKVVTTLSKKSRRTPLSTLCQPSEPRTCRRDLIKLITSCEARSSITLRRQCQIPSPFENSTPMRFLPLRRFPRPGSDISSGLPHPNTLRLQVFSTS